MTVLSFRKIAIPCRGHSIGHRVGPDACCHSEDSFFAAVVWYDFGAFSSLKKKATTWYFSHSFFFFSTVSSSVMI